MSIVISLGKSSILNLQLLLFVERERVEVRKKKNGFKQKYQGDIKIAAASHSGSECKQSQRQVHEVRGVHNTFHIPPLQKHCFQDVCIDSIKFKLSAFQLQESDSRKKPWKWQ